MSGCGGQREQTKRRSVSEAADSDAKSDFASLLPALVTADNHLCPCIEVLYNDTPWMELEALPAGCVMVHDALSQVAHVFGARPLREATVQQDSESMGEDFGQTESLTTRLKGLLNDYPAGTSIIKELVQNADDAGARRVVLIYDGREHATKSLMGGGMKAWQGPALCAYNDALITDGDFRNITKLGCSDKRGQADKIGRFGLGFNSVYHLTDVPSFISGSHAVWLDPHAKYVPGTSTAATGKRFNFVASRSFEKFPDQFAPFHIPSLGMPEDGRVAFDGTLFRFPLL